MKIIGRLKELENIAAVLFRKAPRSLLSIIGAGGVGKTKILEEVVRQYDSQFATALIDFDVQENRQKERIRQSIAEAYGSEHFVEFKRRLAERKAPEAEEKRKKTDPIASAQEAEQMEQAYQAGLRQLQSSPRQRLLLAFDTLERVQDTYLFEDLLLEVNQLQDVVVLVAGRKNDAVNTELEGVFGIEHFDKLVIERFSESETRQYLDHYVGDAVDEAAKHKLYVLSAGTPILLGLAATWVSRQIKRQSLLKPGRDWPTRDLLAMPLATIEGDLAGYRSLFEREVVKGIGDLSSPLDRAILYMALMDSRFTSQDAQYLLEIDAVEAERLIDNLSPLFFVRADLTLHDVLRDLIQEYVWPEVQASSNMKTEALNRLLRKVQQDKQALSGEALWLNHANELHYRLMLDIDDGFVYFDRQFDAALRQKSYQECELLLSTFLASYYQEDLTESMLQTARVSRANLLTAVGQHERANLLLEDRTSPPESSSRDVAQEHSARAFNLRADKPQEALAHYQKALAIYRQSQSEHDVADILNWSGMLLRRRGSIDEARRYFEESVALYFKLGDQRGAANALNNLAYVYRLDGDIERAFFRARSAFIIRQKIGDQMGLGYSRMTLGELYRDLNDLTSAEDDFKNARAIFEELDAEYEVAVVNVKLANIYRKRHEPEIVESLLNPALRTFDKFDDSSEKANTLNEYGCELRKRGRELSKTDRDPAAARSVFREAEARFKQSIEICRERQYLYRLSDNLSDLALLYCFWYENERDFGGEDAGTYRRQTHDAAFSSIAVARRVNSRLIESRAHECLGHLAYTDAEYPATKRFKTKHFKAFARYYIQACILLAEFYGSRLWRYQVVFDRVAKRLLNPKFTEDEVKSIVSYMIRRWQEEGADAVAAGFITTLREFEQHWYLGGIRKEGPDAGT